MLRCSSVEDGLSGSLTLIALVALLGFVCEESSAHSFDVFLVVAAGMFSFTQAFNQPLSFNTSSATVMNGNVVSGSRILARFSVVHMALLCYDGRGAQLSTQ